jgi:hypothetical protein
VVKFNVAPTHTGVLLDATGVAGIGLTVTTVVPAAPVQPFTVIVTEYVPPAASVAPVTDGFCKEEVNPFGPVHEYVAPATSGVVKFRLSPSQMGLLLDAAGVAGMALTVTLTVPVGLVQPATVTVSE